MKFLLPLVLILCIFFPLGADNADIEDSVTMHESAIIIAGRQKVELAHEQWQKFSSKIDWFLEHNNKFLKEYEQQLKAAGDWNDEVTRCKELSEHIFEALEAFLNLRKKTVKTISTDWKDSSHGFSMSTQVCLDLTEMYIAYFETMFFPQGWDSLYKDYLKQKNQTLP